MEVGTAIFCAVDKIEIRRMIWDAVKDKASFFTDGRMSAEVLRVLTACDSASRKHYPTTLFAAGEAYAGPGCTTRASAPHAGITKIVGVKLKPFVHARIYAGRAHGMKGRPMSKSQAKTRKKTRPTRPAGAQLGARGPAFTAGATGGKLLPRIRRLLGADRPGPLSLGRCLSGVLALVTIIAIGVAVGVSCSLAEPSAELANAPRQAGG